MPLIHPDSTKATPPPPPPFLYLGFSGRGDGVKRVLGRPLDALDDVIVIAQLRLALLRPNDPDHDSLGTKRKTGSPRATPRSRKNKHVYNQREGGSLERDHNAKPFRNGNRIFQMRPHSSQRLSYGGLPE